MNAPAAAAPRELLTGLMLAGAGAIAFSCKAIIIKLAYRYGVDPVTLIMYRMLFALPLFLVLSWWAGRNRPGSRSARCWWSRACGCWPGAADHGGGWVPSRFLPLQFVPSRFMTGRKLRDAPSSMPNSL